MKLLVIFKNKVYYCWGCYPDIFHIHVERNIYSFKEKNIEGSFKEIKIEGTCPPDTVV